MSRTVAIISNWGERCGLAEYSANLRKELQKVYDVNVFRDCGADFEMFDAVLLNYHPGVIGFTVDDVRRMQSQGAKVVLLIQESYPRHNVSSSQDALPVVDAVVAHQPMEITSNYGLVNFRMIPHGLPTTTLKHPPSWIITDVPVVGSAGFALPTKRFDIAVRAATRIGGSTLLVTPSHPSYDPRPMWEDLKKLGRVQIEEAWVPQESVVNLLATCTMLVYCADEPVGPGQSGSVRMMAAARRPMIVKRCPKTATLLQYEDELYFVNKEEEVYDIVAGIWYEIRQGRSVKIPSRMLSDLSFETTGQMFVDLIEELCGTKAVSA